jgi:hypothetical protein
MVKKKILEYIRKSGVLFFLRMKREEINTEAKPTNHCYLYIQKNAN